jgi:hypothetical protein
MLRLLERIGTIEQIEIEAHGGQRIIRAAGDLDEPATAEALAVTFGACVARLRLLRASWL